MWVFLHIPKTAGTSFSTSLIDLLQPQAQCPLRTDDDLQHAGNLDEFDYFHGHFTAYTLRQLLPGADIVTMLRGPVARAISQYQSWHDYLNSDPVWHEHLARDSAAAEALAFTQTSDVVQYFSSEMPAIQRQFTNYQTYILSGVDIQQTQFRTWEPAVLAAAKENLVRTFRYFGITERLEGSLDLLCCNTGRPLSAKSSIALNRSRFASDNYSDPSVLRLINSRNAMDLELYDFAVEEFERRCKACGIAASRAASS